MDRESQAKKLAKLLPSFPCPFVISLNGEFGTGKTTYVHMLKQQLEAEGYRCIYFNAWENDFAESPFHAFAGEFADAFKGNLWQEFLEACKKVGPVLVPVIVKGLASKFVGDQCVSELLETATKTLIEKHVEKKKEIIEFKNMLSKIINDLEHKKLIVFVDELDRCKPTFALEILEHIKHLFNTDNVLFILSINQKQLGCSLEAVYGKGLDTGGYLRKFIDFEITLPPPSIDEDCATIFL